MKTWLAARTNLAPQAVVSIGSNSIIGLKSVVPDAAGPGRFHVQIRAEVVNPRTATEGGYLSWLAELDIDCSARRSRAMGIVNYPARDLKGVGRTAGGPSTEWVSPTIGTQLYSLISAVCDAGYQRPLVAPAVVAAQAPPAPAPAPAAPPPAVFPQAPSISLTPAPPQAALAQAPPPRPVPVAPPPRLAPQPAPYSTTPAPVAAAPPPPPPPPPPTVIAQAPPPRPQPPRPAEPAPSSKVQVAVAAPMPTAPPTGASSSNVAPRAFPPAATFAPAEGAPPPPLAAPITPPTRKFSNAAVQIKAAGSEQEARDSVAVVRRLSAEAARLPVAVVKASVGGKTVYRVLLHDFESQGEAAGFCERLKAKGQACFVRIGWGAEARR